jgi:hypothetical protein
MVQGIGFRIVDRADADERQWELLTEPRCLHGYAGQLFVLTPADASKCRVFVNGYPVLGMQAVDPGDWVRVVEDGVESLVYRVGDERSVISVDGNGRRCQFTGLPIRGEAFCCLACGRFYSRGAVEQIDSCSCGASLKVEISRELPAKGLL